MWTISDQEIFVIDELEKLYNKYKKILRKYSNSENELDDYNNFNHPVFQAIYCQRTYEFMRYAEQNFENEKSIKVVRELLDTREKSNIIIACNMLMNLKLKEDVGKSYKI